MLGLRRGSRPRQRSAGQTAGGAAAGLWPSRVGPDRCVAYSLINPTWGAQFDLRNSETDDSDGLYLLAFGPKLRGRRRPHLRRAGLVIFAGPSPRVQELRAGRRSLGRVRHRVSGVRFPGCREGRGWCSLSREPLGLPLAPMPAVPAVLGCGVVVVVLVVVMETCQSLLGGAGAGSAGAPGTWGPAGRRHREPPARVVMVSWRPSGSAVAVGGVASPGAQASSEGLHGDRARSWMVPEGLCRPSEGTVWPHPGTSHTRAALAGKACSGPVVCVRRQGGSGHGFWLLCGAAGDLRGGARPGAGRLRPGSAARSGCTPDGRADLRSPVSCACDGQVHGPLYRLPHREAPAAPALWWPAAGPQRREV